MLGKLLIPLRVRVCIHKRVFRFRVRYRSFSLQFQLKRCQLDTLLPCKTFHGAFRWCCCRETLGEKGPESDNAPWSECISLTQELPALAIWLRLFCFYFFFFELYSLLLFSAGKKSYFEYFSSTVRSTEIAWKQKMRFTFIHFLLFSSAKSTLWGMCVYVRELFDIVNLSFYWFR